MGFHDPRLRKLDREIRRHNRGVNGAFALFLFFWFVIGVSLLAAALEAGDTVMQWGIGIPAAISLCAAGVARGRSLRSITDEADG